MWKSTLLILLKGIGGGGVITIDEDGLQHLKQAQVLISGRYQW